MNSVSDSKMVSTSYENPLGNQGQNFVDRLISQLGASSIETLKKGGLTNNQIDKFHSLLEQMAIKAEERFGKSPNLSDLKIQEFIKTQFFSIISSIVETVENQIPDLIQEVGLSQAAFTRKDDYHPILGTESLATCIGVAGYDPTNKFGFVVHFTNEEEVKVSGAMLVDRIHAYKKQYPNAPLLIHLRGGIKGMSEPLLETVKKWLTSAQLTSIIASEDTLQPPIFQGIGIPKVPASIKLDVRTGTCETYDSLLNPYSNKKNRNVSDFTHLMTDIFVEVATKKPEIRIIYEPKV